MQAFEFRMPSTQDNATLIKKINLVDADTNEDKSDELDNEQVKHVIRENRAIIASSLKAFRNTSIFESNLIVKPTVCLMYSNSVSFEL